MKVISWIKNLFQIELSVTDDNTTKPIDEDELKRSLNEESKRQSDYYYEQHQKKYVGWNPLTDLIETDSNPLNSVEISFLDYIDTKKVRELSLPGYWTYEYNLDFKYVISKLINNGYMIVSSVPEFDRLKVDELKDILRKHNLKVSGKKADLIQRIEENITSEQLSQHFDSFGELYYKTTPLGKELIKSLPISATKDIEFEDECLALIEKSDYYGAYKLVCERESKKPLKRGINIDWERELKRGLPPHTRNLYVKLEDIPIPEIPSEALKAAKMTVIFCHMLRVVPNPKLFNRITRNRYQNDATVFLNRIEHEFLKLQADQEIVELKAQFPNQRYEILLAQDELVCGTCLKFSKKRLPISKAKVGVNFPPFHQGCRCTTIISFRD